MSAILFIATIYTFLYILLSIPAIQNYIKNFVADELSAKTGGKFEIGEISISPFNQIILNDVSIDDPNGAQVIKIGELGAGINIWKLIRDFRLEFTFAEIIGMDAHIAQKAPGESLNIQFLIDAFKSKDDNKEPTKFDLVINNIIIRKSALSFDKQWEKVSKDNSKIDFNHINISNLAADLRLPVIKNDEYEIDLRRLSFNEKSGLNINSINGEFFITPQNISFKGLNISLPGTNLSINDMSFDINGFDNVITDLKKSPISLNIKDNIITPADFSCFLPILKRYSQPWHVSAQIDKNDNIIDIRNLILNSDIGVQLKLNGLIEHFSDKNLSITFPQINIKASSSAVTSLVSDFSPLNKNVNDLILRLGDFNFEGNISLIGDSGLTTGKLYTSLGDIDWTIRANGLKKSLKSINGKIESAGLELGKLIDDTKFGKLIANTDFDIVIGKSLSDISGKANVSIPLFEFNDYPYKDLNAIFSKHESIVNGEFSINDENLRFRIDGVADISGKTYDADIQLHIDEMNISALHLTNIVNAIEIKGDVSLNASGTSLNNSDIQLTMSDFVYSDEKYSQFPIKDFKLNYLHTNLPYSLSIDCDYLKYDMNGDFTIEGIKPAVISILSNFLPELIEIYDTTDINQKQNFTYNLMVYHDTEFVRRLKLPVKLFEPFKLFGEINSEQGLINMQTNIPYMLHGKNKLIKNTNFILDIDTTHDVCNLMLSTIISNNKGDISLMLGADAANNKLDTNISWVFDRKKAYNGCIKLDAEVKKQSLNKPKLLLNINPSTFQVADTVWNVDPALIEYKDKSLNINNLKIYRDNQSVNISGKAGESLDDSIKIGLKHIDLDYVFDVLNINYVTFGGNASGIIYASEIFTSHPHLRTDLLSVENFTYNGAILGDAKIRSYWNNNDKSVKIQADVIERKDLRAKIDGNIWVTKDSLSFDFDARKLNLGLMKPFVAAFSSDLKGRGTGKVKLYGTFKDINLIGKVYADTLKMKIDITNTWYSMSDSVFMSPGKITIPKVKLYDRDGHTALFSGELRHNYFHDPSFDFRINNAKDFLCYDTEPSDNPVWYGTIYGNGSGRIKGIPGFIDINVDMTIAPRSSFTFVLDDKEVAEQFDFLTFTDKNKKVESILIDPDGDNKNSVPQYISQYITYQQPNVSRPTRYKMDLRVTATPDGVMTLVMDPVAGDKIKAYGDGALRIGYNSEGDLSMFGTYTLQRGSYNFSLQDLIVRDFKIKEGSKITFTGDPLDATLDINAAYRVNTNLRDLDKSFASDRDLNRTNVPVEAILKISGNMNNPDINFDIELPTLTEDVTKKIKSIISTSDMMNRQIIYLLSLNRFYTPDYMSTNSNNNELASVASTTLSTQLSSMLGQLSNNWNFMPNIRTDKGDFSDTEFDLALSSTLLNNRLLLNGNFGYRDRSTSSTSFIGDFDIEYLINNTGSLRLKAYNHFNDQNYYLKSSLTTQGIGMVYKHDFDNFINLFKRRKEDKYIIHNEGEDLDSINQK